MHTATTANPDYKAFLEGKVVLASKSGFAVSPGDLLHTSKDWLIEKYIAEKLDCVQIGKLNNLVLLCNSCHKWVHSKRNVNKECLGTTMEAGK